MKKELIEGFKEPSWEWRGAPFWSWNDRLDPEELVRQVYDMKEHGMGGFFMHSREGLETEYMGPEWMECIRATVAAAREAGMGAWLYDEDRWPSGAAGGLVPARGGDKVRAKGLTMEMRKDPISGKDDDILAAFTARVEGDKILEARRLKTGGELKPGEGEVLLIFRREIAAPTGWYNGDSPSDNLSPESVALFIETTYEAYRREIGDDFGKVVPGVFTDEPNVDAMKMASRRPHIPWTDGLDQYFLDRRGYDLLDVVPYIFLEGKKSQKARHDYNRTITERFCEAYSRQLGEWCGRNNLFFTGHYLQENSLGDSIRLGGAIMPHYRYQQLPGIDMLCERTEEYLTVKQCTSVAHQYGRRRVLSETYGCTGWEFTFEGQKWVGDWQYVMGVNLRCQHLALYTLRGCRKRDYPPSFNYNTTWWERNNVVEDYFARLGRILASGEPVRDILMLHPVSTGWTMVGGGKGLKEADELGQRLNTFVKKVLAAHFDFDFGDELIIEEVGRVEGEEFVVKEGRYKVVLIPPGTRNLLSTTLELIRQFVEGGGVLIVVGPPPSMVDGEESPELARFFEDKRVVRVTDEDEIMRTLEVVLPRRLCILDERGIEASSILHMQVALDDPEGAMAFFLVNNDRDRGYKVRVDLGCSGRVEEWDPLTGQIRPVPISVTEDGISLYADFGPAASHLYLVFPDEEPLVGSEPAAREVGVTFIGPLCSFKRSDPNILTLDLCSYRFLEGNGGGSWSDPMPVWQAQRKIREVLGMEQVYYNGGVQRYKWVDKPHPKDGTPVEFRFEFQVDIVPETQVYLILEGAEDFEVSLNGLAAAPPDGWYLDRAFKRVPLPPLKEGMNELILRCGYRNRMEVEDVFLAGDFGVDVVTRAIIKEPEKLHFGDWCSQGYPHYAGTMTYFGKIDHKPVEGERVIVTLGEYRAITVSLYVNGKLAGHIPWRAANGVDITDYLVEGENELAIEVFASPRNMLGPLHRAAGREPWTSWVSFRTEGARYTPDYVLEPFGLFGQVRCSRIKRS